jgi:hypothetical protein
MEHIIDGLPNICGNEPAKPESGKRTPEFATNIDFSKVKSSFGVALHMHQPTIPAGGGDLQTAALIGNLQHMMDNQGIGDNHNAPVFLQCYARMAELIPELVSQGRNPRVMFDYSGNLLWGLPQMGQGWVLDKLRAITGDPKYFPHVEWLGTMWSHAVVSSTPVPDIALHIAAWRRHFTAMFGDEANARVKGFSPPEMHLPIHPDVCYEYVKALLDNGYEWLMVQEHTIENVDGSRIDRHHFPHKLVAKNSRGETLEIPVLIKTQGSDTKLVAQMQPYYEAKGLSRQDFGNVNIPPFVLQIADGENGGVMMNEFPPCYRQAHWEIGREGTVALNGSEYLGHVRKAGFSATQYLPVQPITQQRIWKEISQPKPGAADEAIAKIKQKDPNYNLDKGSWTSDKSWVHGYESVLDPINRLSAEFHAKFDGKKVDCGNRIYRESLLYLLLSQTSCFRYWGQGVWTDYAREICRRGFEAIKRA